MSEQFKATASSTVDVFRNAVKARIAYAAAVTSLAMSFNAGKAHAESKVATIRERIDEIAGGFDTPTEVDGAMDDAYLKHVTPAGLKAAESAHKALETAVKARLAYWRYFRDLELEICVGKDFSEEQAHALTTGIDDAAAGLGEGSNLQASVGQEQLYRALGLVADAVA
ncbi:hypothetical protein F6X40_17555 [Paraburkholderia sp. UCT31]|uniref:hypothetical protein n=1 Tax=Paraburkholderia sp. UCT31 TaxID=2615209 RepID=UPI0016567CF0|nr:hypothetical protein [Paraburkholderia sp. UCT31]MBC8738567.1 hypothetical protein [Paraburkholderia sp. UCT31]